MSRFEPLAKLAHKSLFLLKRHSPEILTGAGVIGVVASGVMLVRAGMKTPEIIGQHKADMMVFEETSSQVSSEQNRKDTYYRYAKTGGELAKIYSVPILTGVVGVSCIVGGHGQLRKRNFAYAAAYKALEETFQNYRNNVAEVLGEDAEKDIKRGVQVEEYETDKGEVKTRKSINSHLASGYSRVFDGSNSNWQGDPDYNVMFLQRNQQWANDLFQLKGYMFLNDVYERLGFEKTKAGQIVGWLNDDSGDGFVDFGISDWDKIVQNAIADGIEGHILLDFNVDGPILDRLPKI